jgi:ATP phosphoribosyltransferase regulatory subunit
MSGPMTKKTMPTGARPFLPDQAERKRLVEANLLAVFARWGFREILTPVIDFCTSAGDGEVRDTQTFRFSDRETGGMLALRADVTPQIARIAGTMLASHPRPLRLCYLTNVFRHTHVAGILQREFWQAGAELIGLDSLEADVEMIAIAVECLQQNGLENYRISLSHTAFLRGLLDDLRLNDMHRAEVLEAIERRDVSGLEKIVEEFPKEKRGSAKSLLALPEWFGGVSILDRAGKNMKNRTSRRALAELKQVHRMLKLYGLADRVLFDLSDFRDFDYYTGVIFEGFVEGSGYPVCGGGRYDRLLGQYGTDGLGTGFAIDVEQILRLSPDNQMSRESTDFLVIDFTEKKRMGITIARELRDRGWRVARDIIRRDLGASLEYARRARIPKCLIVDPEKTRNGRVRLLDSDGREIMDFDVREMSEYLGTRMNGK